MTGTLLAAGAGANSGPAPVPSGVHVLAQAPMPAYHCP